MASEGEASCESDPNFAIICAFFEKFGETCGIENIDFVELQQMLENSQEVAPELVDLHIKLLRKTKRKVIPERWERSLVNMCHAFSSKDAWEIERFGYKKTRLKIKLRALKELLEMQFDYNTKFKNEINKMTAKELRPQPLGRDKLGRNYWFQADNNYQVRVYKEDPDEETWKLIAKDREGLMTLITELTDGDSKLSSDSACNEDSNSLLEKPFIDTGQKDEEKKDSENNESGDSKTEESKEINSFDGISNKILTKEVIEASTESSEEMTKDEEDDVKRPVLRIKSLSELMGNSKDEETLETESNKKLKLDLSEDGVTKEAALKDEEVSAAVEAPTLIIEGKGSGVDNECGKIEETDLFISEEIEEPVFFVYGVGSGKDSEMGNEKEPTESNNCSNNGESIKQVSNNIKLGTIIDSKIDNKTFSPRDPNKKSRWDQKGAGTSEPQIQEIAPVKPTFFFGPGSLNAKPINVMSTNVSDTNSIEKLKEEDKLKKSTKGETEAKVDENLEDTSEKPENLSEQKVVKDEENSCETNQEKNVDANESDNQVEIDDLPKVPRNENKSPCTMEMEKVPSPSNPQEDSAENDANDALIPATNDNIDISQDVGSAYDNKKVEENKESIEKIEELERDKSESNRLDETVESKKDISDVEKVVESAENEKDSKNISAESEEAHKLNDEKEEVTKTADKVEKIEESLIVDNNSEKEKETENIEAYIEQINEKCVDVKLIQEKEDIDSTSNKNSNRLDEKLKGSDSTTEKDIDTVKEPKLIEEKEIDKKSTDIEQNVEEKQQTKIVEDTEHSVDESESKEDPDTIKIGENDEISKDEIEGDETREPKSNTQHDETNVEKPIRETRQTRSSKMNESANKDAISKSDESNDSPPIPLESVTVVDTDSNSAAADSIETDPLAVSEEDQEKPAQPVSSITNFSFDYNPSSPEPTTVQVERNLRKRGREETKPEAGETSEKRPKMKGKRSIDLNLRKSVEEKRQQEVGDGSSDENEEVKSKKETSKTQPKKKAGTSSLSDTDNASVKSQPTKKTSGKNKRILKNLGLNEEDISAIADSPTPVRQSRRLAQLKIKEEASRRKLEEEEAAYKKKKKKNEDKDFKAGKRKRLEDELKPASISPVIEKKKKKKKKHDKITIGWNTSSEDSDNSGREDEEGSEYEYEEPNEDDTLQFKSDHEFSPESDLEGDEQLPLKRARTARKEESDDDETDEEFPCQKCGKADHPEWILLCDKCDNGWHCSCLRPALFVIPEGDWYCPTCQHESLLQKLEEKLRDFDRMLVKKEMEDRRKERLAYVGISLNNVLPAKEKREKTKRSGSEESSVAGGTGTESGSGSVSEGSGDESDSDEPIYQLRQRRQAHSYKFQDYDDLINSALQEEPSTTVEKTHTLGRGKDIATIVNAAKEEEEKNGDNAFEDLPPVVPKDTVESRKKAVSYRKKPKRLNNLEVNSDDEADDSDEDFKGSSSDESDEDDFEEDSDDSFVGRKGSRPTRRSTRARTRRYDADFINDDDDDDDSDDMPIKKKKKRTFYDDDESESELSDDWKGKKKSSKKNKKKTFEDSDLESYRRKKSKIKYGMGSDEVVRGRRTRGKKTSYLDTLGSDSDEESLSKKQSKKSKESSDDDEYVIDDDKEESEEDAEKESENESKNSESEDEIPRKVKKLKIKKRKAILESDGEDEDEAEDSVDESKEKESVQSKNSNENSNENGTQKSTETKSSDEILDVKRSKYDEPVTKEPSKLENSLKKVRTGRFFNMKPQESLMHGAPSLITNNEEDNDELSEPPGAVLPIFDMPNNRQSLSGLNQQPLHNLHSIEQLRSVRPLIQQQPMGNPQILGANVPESNCPSPDSASKKRRGRGKGKKTLAAEAAVSEASPPPKAAKTLAANIEIASPPQPFSQSQPAPSVITRMLQNTAPVPATVPSYLATVGRIRTKQFAMMPDGNVDKELESHVGDKDLPPHSVIVPHPPTPYVAPPPTPYPPNYYPKDGAPPPPFHHQRSQPLHPYPPPHSEQPPPPPMAQAFTNPSYNYDYNVQPPPQQAAPPPAGVLNTDDGIPPPVYENNGGYPEHYESSVGNLEANIQKNVDEEPSGEFGGLVSYFSSQHEDDLDN